MDNMMTKRSILPRSFASSTAIAQVQAAVDIANGERQSDAMLRRSNDSAAMVPYWDKVDAIMGGVETMRLSATIFLPKFEDETTADHQSRVNYSKFTNIFNDIVENLSAKPFEKEINLTSSDEKTDKVPQTIQDFCEDVDGAGNTLTTFAAATFFNGIAFAIDWIFVDFPKADRERIRTMADAKAAGIRPFWSHVLGRNVLEARSKVINGKETLVYIRIHEPGEPDHVRVFERNDAGIVTWQLWQKTQERGANNETLFIVIDEGTLSINIIPLVPFAAGRRNGRTFKYKPMMQDAADLQIELFQEESGLKFMSIMSSYPMLAGNGVSPPMAADGKTPLKLRIGPGKVLYSKANGDGKFGHWTYVEPSSNNAKFLQDKIEKTKQDLRELGRQPLTAQSGNLTVITTAFAAGKAKSAIAACANILKNALENALMITALWMNEKYEPEVYVFDEFDAFLDDGKDVDALNTMRKNGDLSQRTYWDEMKRRKVLSDEFDAEAEQERLLDETPNTDPNLDENNPPA